MAGGLVTWLTFLLACGGEPPAPPPEAPPVEEKERTKSKGKRRAKRPSRSPDDEGLAALLDAQAPIGQADPACRESGIDPDTKIGAFARDLHEDARRVETDCRATACKVTIHGVFYSELTFEVRDGALVGKSLKCVFAG